MAADDDFLRATLPAMDLVHNLARRFVPQRADAEDLVQETYLRAWQAWTSGRLPRRVEPWLATICLNVGRDWVRRSRSRREERIPDAFEATDDVDVELEAIDRMRRKQVDQAMWALPREQRITITLVDVGGFTAAEVAGMTGSPRGTVLARLHRGRKALARLVQQEESRHAP
jgi:RNA polymerase sigma-70 factor (ECF subfamily)